MLDLSLTLTVDLHSSKVKHFPSAVSYTIGVESLLKLFVKLWPTNMLFDLYRTLTFDLWPQKPLVGATRSFNVSFKLIKYLFCKLDKLDKQKEVTEYITCSNFTGCRNDFNLRQHSHY